MICTSDPDKTSYYQAGCTFQKPFYPWSGSAPPPINNIMDNLATTGNIFRSQLLNNIANTEKRKVLGPKVVNASVALKRLTSQEALSGNTTAGPI